MTTFAGLDGNRQARRLQCPFASSCLVVSAPASLAQTNKSATCLETHSPEVGDRADHPSAVTSTISFVWRRSTTSQVHFEPCREVGGFPDPRDSHHLYTFSSSSKYTRKLDLVSVHLFYCEVHEPDVVEMPRWVSDMETEPSFSLSI